MTKASDNVFPKLIGAEGAAPGTPASATAILYVKADGLWYSKDDAGVETLVSGGAGGGSVATDAIWDAKGDLAVGTGVNTAAKLTVGANGSHPIAASGEATGIKWEGGPWTDYTPTVTATTTNPTQGSSVIAGRFKLLDATTGILTISWTITTGGAWNAGSGSYSFSLPSGWTSSATLAQQLAGKFLDSGTDNKVATGTISPGSTVVTEVVIEAINTFSNSSPVTLATGDTLILSGIIEIQ